MEPLENRQKQIEYFFKGIEFQEIYARSRTSQAQKEFELIKIKTIE